MVPINVNAVFYASTYHPIQAGSIDGTDTAAHDNAVYRALLASSTGLYDPTGDPKVEGDPYCSIFVGRLSRNTTEATLNKGMSKYGRIKRLRLVRDIVTGASQGYAFVEYETEKEMRHAYEAAHQSMIDGSQVLVDYNRQQVMAGWIPRRLGGGLGGRKESGQLRFGGRDRPFRAPLRPIPHEELQKLGIPLPPQGRYLSRFQMPPLPRRQKESSAASHSRHGSHVSQSLPKCDLLTLEASVKTHLQPDCKFQDTSQRTENVALVLDGDLQTMKLSDADRVQSDLVHHKEDSNSKLLDDRKRHKNKQGKMTSVLDEDMQSKKSLETDRVQSDDLYHKEDTISKEDDRRKRHRSRHGESEDIVVVPNEATKVQSYDVYHPSSEEVDDTKRRSSHRRAADISSMHAEDLHSTKSLEAGRVQSDDMYHKNDPSPKEVGDRRRHRSKEVDDKKMHRSKHRKRHREDKSADDEQKRPPLHGRHYHGDETSHHQSRYKHHSEHSNRKGHKEDESYHELYKHGSEDRKRRGHKDEDETSSHQLRHEHGSEHSRRPGHIQDSCSN